MASTSDPAANKGKAPALYGGDDDDRHRDMVTKMMMMKEERVSMGIPPGWRFCPTDEELIVFYLRNRTWNNSRIIHLDIYDFTPMQLAGLFLSPSLSLIIFFNELLIFPQICFLVVSKLRKVFNVFPISHNLISIL